MLSTEVKSPPGKSVLRQTPYTSPFEAVYVDAGAAPFAHGPLARDDVVLVVDVVDETVDAKVVLPIEEVVETPLEEVVEVALLPVPVVVVPEPLEIL